MNYHTEVLVCEQWLEKIASPLASDGDSTIMTIARHVRGDEHPLRQLIVLEILLEEGHVLNVRQSFRLLRYRVVQHRRVVLANIHVGASLLVPVVLALKSCVWHVCLLLVYTQPRNSACPPSWYSPQLTPWSSSRSTTVETLEGILIRSSWLTP
jgi:hypothetical protein